MPHDVEFEHFHATTEEAEKLSEAIWRVDNVVLTTVGIDIGSTTSHFMISRVHLQRAANALSSRFIVVGRDELWRSPILLTPYRDDYSIDAGALKTFVEDGFATAGIAPDAIDTGAVILTGEALKRRNARAIADLFAGYSGRFVCASAGHHLECMLAAQGSGATALSRQQRKTVVNVDIGGGTTKFALIQNGEILSTAAIAVGGRLIAWNDDGIVRLEQPAFAIAQSLGFDLRVGATLHDEERRALARRMSELIVTCLRQGGLDGDAGRLMLTDPLQAQPRPEIVTFSGGVAEFLFGRETGQFGDLGPFLARSLQHRLSHGAVAAQVWDPGQGLRATVVGASQFTVQVSGNTIYIANPERLPISNLPVVFCPFALEGELVDERDMEHTVRSAFLRHDLAPDEDEAAVAFRWSGTPSHARLQAVARVLLRVVSQGEHRKPIVLLVDGDVGRSLGHMMAEQLASGVDVISIDGMQLRDFDFVDIGSRIDPAGVVPVIIKSLLFPGPTQ